jgi:hypothetical protein
MADNLYDYLNRFNLGQLGAAGNRLLQGAANTLNRYGIGQPGGLTSLRPATGKQKNSNTFSDPAGREKITNAWGNLQSPDFGYIAGQLPSYQDAQGNVYDAVSGRLMWRTGSKGSSSASASNLGSRNPSERAYQAEASRVAQLTAQDPELQRYEAARKLAVAPGATPEQVQSAEDIGMQIWAQKYGKTLAPKVKPGQSGYDAIQGVLNAGAMGTPMDLPFDTKNVLGGKPMPEGLSYGTTAPTAIPGGTPIKGGGFPEGQAAMFERFMQGPATAVPTFQGSPLGTTPQLNALNYGGAVQPLGAAVSDDFYKTEKAKELAAMFANYRLGQ